MRSIIIGWGKLTEIRSRYTGRRTSISGYGNNAPEIEADALARTAGRFAPGALLDVDPDYSIRPIGQRRGMGSEDEVVTRPPGLDDVPRLYYAELVVRELKQPVSRARPGGAPGPS